MIREQDWAPDHCTCIIRTAYDDSVDPVVIIATEHLRKCPDHRNVQLANLHDVVNEENTRKQNVRARILTALPVITRTILQLDGTSYTDFLPERQPTFVFDASRILTITIPGITNQQRNSLQTAADNRVGPGKVIIG